MVEQPTGGIPSYLSPEDASNFAYLIDATEYIFCESDRTNAAKRMAAGELLGATGRQPLEIFG
jgi:hypothetical protein